MNIKACLHILLHILLHQIHKIMIFKKASYDPFNLISPPLGLLSQLKDHLQCFVIYSTIQKFGVGAISKMFLKKIFYAHQGYIYFIKIQSKK